MDGTILRFIAHLNVLIGDLGTFSSVTLKSPLASDCKDGHKGKLRVMV